MAGKSTLNRLELSRLEPTRYHKISHNPVAIKRLLVDLFLEAHERPPNEIILDLDATDDPVHGAAGGAVLPRLLRLLLLPAALREAAERGNTILQRFLQHQCEEAAEHVAADGLVELVEDRPCREQVLGGAESLLHRPQLLVAEHGRERVEVGIGAQYEDAVELVVLRDLVGINREVLVADRLQVTAVAGVADQRLVALGELALQRGDDGSTIGGVVLGLLMIAADDVASTGQHHGLGLVVGLLAALVDGQRHERRGILEHQLAHQLVAALAHAETYRSRRASSSATVSALIMPRSATTHTRAMAKRRRSRSITGISVVTSAVLPGHIRAATSPGDRDHRRARGHPERFRFARAVDRLRRAHARRRANLQGGLAVAACGRARSPCAPRLVLIACIATFVAAGGERWKRIAAAFDWQGVVLPANFRVDAWVTPPAYTGKPPVILAGIHPGETARAADAAGEPVTVPAGSTLVGAPPASSTSTSPAAAA